MRRNHQWLSIRLKSNQLHRFALLAVCKGNQPMADGSPRKRPVVWKAFPCHASLCILTSNPMDVGDYHNRTRCATLRPRQNGHHFPDDIFKHIFRNEDARNPIKIWLKFVLYCPITNNSAFAQLMPCRRSNITTFTHTMKWYRKLPSVLSLLHVFNVCIHVPELELWISARKTYAHC